MPALEVRSKSITTYLDFKIRKTASDQSLLNNQHESRTSCNHSSQVWSSSHVDFWRNTLINDQKRNFWRWSPENALNLEYNWSRAHTIVTSWGCTVEIIHEIVYVEKQRNLAQSSILWFLHGLTPEYFHSVGTQLVMCTLLSLTWINVHRFEEQTYKVYVRLKIRSRTTYFQWSCSRFNSLVV